MVLSGVPSPVPEGLRATAVGPTHQQQVPIPQACSDHKQLFAIIWGWGGVEQGRSLCIDILEKEESYFLNTGCLQM